MSTSDTAAAAGRRRALRARLGALFAVVLLLASGVSDAATVLKIATLAPDGSSWVRALRDIDAELRSTTEDQVQLKIYPGGVQGDEDVMLRKIRIGQLHGAGLGGTGVSHICRDVLALEMPFLFDGYDEVDYVIQRMADFYRAGFLESGYILLGWSDIGFVYLLSQKPVYGADDMRGRKVWRLHGEPITEVLFAKAGVTSVPLTIPDVLLGLQTNLVDVVYASPAAAIVLQWFTRVKHYTDLPINYSIGAFVVHRRFFDELSAEHQGLLRAIAGRHIRAHNLRGRKDNEDALQVMRKEGVQPVTPPTDEVASFRALVEDSKPELVGKAFSREAYEGVVRHLDDFRQQPGPPAADD